MHYIGFLETGKELISFWRQVKRLQKTPVISRVCLLASDITEYLAPFDARDIKFFIFWIIRYVAIMGHHLYKKITSTGINRI